MSARWAALLGLMSLLAFGPAQAEAGAGERVLDLLDRARIEEASRLLPALEADDPWTPFAQAAWAFFRGDYPTSLAALPAPGAHPPGDRRTAWLRARLPGALAATDGMAERAGEHFLYRWRPGPDEALVAYASDALEAQFAILSDLLGVSPSQPTVVEFFPTVDAFITASGLPAEWVHTTGTVAIAKWDRMLVVSPMNMPRGYPWMDTIAHEYTHLALARASHDHAPIWFQEGTAKVLESAWRGGDLDTWLDAWSETLLAEALRDDRLIPFASMHPSMAALPSSRDAGQAFAQVAFAVSWLIETAGEEGFRRVADATARHGDVMRAIDGVLGPVGGSFEKRYARRMAQVGMQVRAVLPERPVDLAEGAAKAPDERSQELDPVLVADRRMQDLTRVGDMLRLRGHNQAAVLEYQRADVAGAFHSPALANKTARALRALGDVDAAREVLRASILLEREYTPTLTLLAELAAQRGDDAEVLDAARGSIALNPFDPNVHAALLQACDRVGETACVAREQAALAALGYEREPQ